MFWAYLLGFRFGFDLGFDRLRLNRRYLCFKNRLLSLCITLHRRYKNLWIPPCHQKILTLLRPPLLLCILNPLHFSLLNSHSLNFFHFHLTFMNFRTIRLSFNFPDLSPSALIILLRDLFFKSKMLQ